MSESTKTALAVVAVIAIAGAFWLLLLAPKRDKASELSEQTTQLSSEVASEQSRAESSLAAKKNFSTNYSDLVELGKSVPAEAATPSLLVQLEVLSRRSKTSFESITGAEGDSGAAEEPTTSTEGSTSLLPLGAGVGPAGLAAMPYQLQFEGGFFDIADFIHGLDSQVETKNGKVDSKGRLITIDGFNMTGEEGEGTSAKLSANFSVTTYVTPPGQGLTAGATSAGPAEETVAEIP